MEKTREELAAEAEAAFHARVSDSVSTAVTSAMEPIEGRLDAMDARMAVMEDSGRDHDLPGSTEERFHGETYSFAKVMQAVASQNPEKVAPMEWAMSQDLAERSKNGEAYVAQGTTPDDLGGFLVPNEVHNEMLIPLLQPRIIATRLGLTQMTDAVGTPVEIPMIVTEPTPEAVAENQGTPDQNMTFGMLQMTPKTCQTYLVSSRKFLRMGTGAEGIIRETITRGLARKYNEWALNGTGTDGEPTGILNTTGIGSQTWTGTEGESSDYNNLLDMEGVLADANVLEDGDTPTWVAPYAFIRMLRQMKSQNASAGVASLEVNRKVFSEGKESAIIGLPFIETNLLSSLTASELLLGVWSHMIFAQWGNMVIEASNVAGDALRRRQTHIVAYTDIDYGVRYPEAFVSATGLDVSGF